MYPARLFVMFYVEEKMYRVTLIPVDGIGLKVVFATT
jgi:hypothetical protein